MNQKSLDKKKTKELIMSQGGRGCNHPSKTTAKTHPKELDWETELDNLECPNNHNGDECCLSEYDGKLKLKLKSFISSILLKQKEQILNLECLKLTKQFTKDLSHTKKCTCKYDKDGKRFGLCMRCFKTGLVLQTISNNKLRKQIKEAIINLK